MSKRIVVNYRDDRGRRSRAFFIFSLSFRCWSRYRSGVPRCPRLVYEDAELALVFGVKTNPSKRIVRKNKHDHLTEDDIKSFILSYLENEGYEALSVEIKDELSEKMKLLDEIFEGIR